MKIICCSVGTRGDMEPFLALGELLKKNGHQVICAFPDQFKQLVQESQLDFFSLGTEFIELLETEEARYVMSGAAFGWKKLKAIFSLYRKQEFVNKLLVENQKELIDRENPNLILYHAKAVYPVIWSQVTGGKSILVCTIPYVHEHKSHAQIGFNKNWGETLNKLSYKIAHFALRRVINATAKQLNPPIQLNQSQLKDKIKWGMSVYTLSRYVFPRPSYWPSQIQVVGFLERDKQQNWVPSNQLLDFVQKHQRFLVLTFGSMINPHPERNSKRFLKILNQLNIPCVVIEGAGGLVKPKGYTNNSVLFLKSAPYDWLFEKAYAVVHHGGAGTTHMALKYGCPNLIIPHIVDQYTWNKINANNGWGPKGMALSKVKEKWLKKSINDLWENPAYLEATSSISKLMLEESKDPKLELELLNFLIT